MASHQNNHPEDHKFSVPRVLCFGGLALLVGFVLALTIDLFTTPEIVAKLPKKEKHRTHYVVSTQASPVSTWKPKFVAFLQKKQKSLTFTDQDLTAIINHKIELKNYTKGKKLFRFRHKEKLPSIFIKDKEVHVTTHNQIFFIGKQFDVYTTHIGEFEKNGDEITFNVKKLYVGSAQIPIYPFFANFTLDSFIRSFKKQKEADILLNAWRSIANATTNNNHLIIEWN